MTQINTAVKDTDAPKATQSRWRSKVLWGAIAAQVLALLQLTGALDAMGIDAGQVGNVIAAVFGLLSILGIINDPTNKTGA